MGSIGYRLGTCAVAICLWACGDDTSTVDASTGDASADASVDGTVLDSGTDAPLADAGDDGGFDGGFMRLEGDVTHPMDDTLRLNHLQAEGTHNSYHQRPSELYPVVPADFDYAFDPLDVQLETQGVRKFELDVWWDVTRNRYNVLHIPTIDPETSCETFVECLAIIRTWSDAHPGHHPIFIQVETKSGFDEGTPGLLQIDTLDAEIATVFPSELLVTPALVQGEAANVRDAVTGEGWPTLGETRGRTLLFLNCERSDCIRYGNLPDRLAFADGDGTDTWSGVRVINTPGAEVRAAVEAGFIVRTRAFGHAEVLDGDEAVMRAGLEAAIESGAQMISTDLPGPIAGLTFFTELPGGTPSTCNPLTAPVGCTPEAIEDPARLVP